MFGFSGASSECNCGFSEKYDLLSSLVPVQQHVLDRYAQNEYVLGDVAELVALFGTQNDSGSDAWQRYRDSVSHMAFSCHSPAGTSTSTTARPRVSPASNTACTLR